nr:AAA family ATPase [Candidatus Burkholderia verschuerenii]
MYVHRVFAENFRAFGASIEDKHLDLYLRKGLNVLVGENDAGKTCIVDVIRYVLLTTSNDWVRIEEDDFHIEGDSQADELQLEVELRGLNKAQQAALLDWLTLEDGVDPYLVVNLRAKRRLESNSGSRLSSPLISANSGKGGGGPEIGSHARALIRATYLKPLRDAVAELRPKKGSRLSQVLRAHKDVKKESANNFDKSRPDEPPPTLVEIMAQTQYRIGNKQVVKDVREKLNNDYLKTLSFENSTLSSDIRVSAELTLAQILERLELTLRPPGGVSQDIACERGLGYNNVLFMAAELLLLSDGEGDELALLLIEEPEAHLHPQLQTRVLSMLSEKASSNGIQVVVTTHSPNIASTAPVDTLTIVKGAKAFRLERSETCLDESDYEFLHRFLDATKANLFFARGVMIVEGPAEAIVLPALAEAAGSSFERNSVSIISVGGVGIFRFARILQRKNDDKMPINVACIGDLDVVPDDVSYIEGRLDKIEAGIPKTKDGKEHQKRKARDFAATEIDELRKRKKERAEGGSTEVFIADHWTLEYDLLRSGIAKHMFSAIRLEQAEGTKSFGAVVTLPDRIDDASAGLARRQLALQLVARVFERDAIDFAKRLAVQIGPLQRLIEIVAVIGHVKLKIARDVRRGGVPDEGVVAAQIGRNRRRGPVVAHEIQPVVIGLAAAAQMAVRHERLVIAIGQLIHARPIVEKRRPRHRDRCLACGGCRRFRSFEITRIHATKRRFERAVRRHRAGSSQRNQHQKHLAPDCEHESLLVVRY